VTAALPNEAVIVEAAATKSAMASSAVEAAATKTTMASSTTAMASTATAMNQHDATPVRP
jgi:hypothetical protein